MEKDTVSDMVSIVYGTGAGAEDLDSLPYLTACLQTASSRII